MATNVPENAEKYQQKCDFIVMVLLSAHSKRVGVSRMHYYIYIYIFYIFNWPYGLLALFKDFQLLDPYPLLLLLTLPDFIFPFPKALYLWQLYNKLCLKVVGVVTISALQHWAWEWKILHEWV